MSELFGMPKAPPAPPPAPPPPSLTDPAIANRAAETMRERQRGGRASQVLTNPQTQDDEAPSAARRLGAA